MFWRDSAPIPFIFIFPLITVVFLLSLVSICVLGIATVYKLGLMIIALLYFLRTVNQFLKKQPVVEPLSNQEFLATVDDASYFVTLTDDSIITRWFLVLHFHEVGGSRHFTKLSIRQNE